MLSVILSTRETMHPPKRTRKFETVEAFLRAEIKRGALKPGARTYSEAELTRKLNVSRVTVRKAIGGLVAAGVLDSRPGFGHVVRSEESLRTVGLVYGHRFTDPASVPFYRVLVAAMREQLAQRGFEIHPYLLRIGGLEHQADRDRLIEDARRSRIRGLITLAWPCLPSEDAVAARKDAELAEIFKTAGVPFTGITQYEIPAAVGTDAHSVGDLAVRHFYSRNIRRIAFMQAHACGRYHDPIKWGWMDAVAAHGLDCAPEWMCLADDNTEAHGYQAFRRWWPASGQPEAILVADDFLCKGAMTAAVEMGIEIPRRLQFAAPVTKDVDVFFLRPLVRLEMDPVNYARTVIEHLLAMIRNPGAVPPPAYLKPTLREDPGA